MPVLSKDKGKQREQLSPPFLAPPSQNSSHVSLPEILVSGNNLVSGTNAATSPSPTSAPQRAALTRQRSGRANNRSLADNQPDTVTGPVLSRTSLPRQQQASDQILSDRTDALWAEMQSTLEEVELSTTNGMHVFRPEHTKALEELRTAQIALAQAWARSEADDAMDSMDKESKINRTPGVVGSEGRTVVDNTDGARSTANSASGRPASSLGADKAGSKPETETDILLARKRREANDKYFQRVNEGVLEVVAKLEEVAMAMRAVDQGSKNIWGEESPVPSINS